ncbi:MAG: hypothetical protein KAI16_02145 [Candidatus Pacebacteria bacterium]|nr:hypothetical protein [Candidatus Paceibacterota bacterium]
MDKWNYIETEEFIRFCEDNRVSQKVRDSIKIWAESVRRQITPRNKRPFISSNNIFEIWVAGIGNPDANKGKSGGYRILYYIHIEKHELTVDRIEDRKNLDFKGSKGKKQKQWDKHFLELKQELIIKYERRTD